MDLRGKKIILGSNSARRKELLAALDVEFTVDTRNNFVEQFSPDVPHSEVPRLMSEGKSLGFHRPLKTDEILITADTMVFLGPSMMGKPKSAEEAASMLRELSGREHQVITAVTIRNQDRFETFTDKADVWFKELSEEEISYYIEKYKPYDKAGAYGIQEWIGYACISRIDGSFYNVMGFPTHLVYEKLKSFLI